MIDENDIIEALTEHLLTAGTGLRAILEGESNVPARPYLLTRFEPERTRRLALKGGSELHQGTFKVWVAHSANGNAEDAFSARAIATQIRQHFAVAAPLVLTIPGGKVNVTFAELKQGYPDGVGYRVPVHVRYQAF